jgi:hypothetical protein
MVVQLISFKTPGKILKVVLCIRIPIKVNLDPDPGFDDQKLEKIQQKKFKFF